MSAPDATMDRPLHLTLPDWRTALKRRVKRPKRPSGWQMFWLAYTALNLGLGVWAYLTGQWLTVVADLAAVGYGWWAVMTRQTVIVWRYYGPLMVLMVVQMMVPQR